MTGRRTGPPAATRPAGRGWNRRVVWRGGLLPVRPPTLGADRRRCALRATPEGGRCHRGWWRARESWQVFFHARVEGRKAAGLPLVHRSVGDPEPFRDLLWLFTPRHRTKNVAVFAL